MSLKYKVGQMVRVVSNKPTHRFIGGVYKIAKIHPTNAGYYLFIDDDYYGFYEYELKLFDRTLKLKRLLK